MSENKQPAEEAVVNQSEEIEFCEIVCSAEFSDGCTEPVDEEA